jgi:hypothetical protein
MNNSPPGARYSRIGNPATVMPKLARPTRSTVCLTADRPYQGQTGPVARHKARRNRVVLRRGDTGGHGSGDDAPDDTGRGRRASIASVAVAATVAIRPAAMSPLAMLGIVAAAMSRSRLRRVRRSERQDQGGCQHKHGYLSSY